MEPSEPDQLKDFEIIGRFHDFELSEKELKYFEERLENDPVFQEHFRLYQEMDRYIDEVFPAGATRHIKEAFKADLQEKKVARAAKIRTLPVRRILAIAAAVSVLLIAGIWWMDQGEVFHTNVALADHYWDTTDKAHLFELIQRSDGSVDPNEQARTFFRNIRKLQQDRQFSTMIDQLEAYRNSTATPVPFTDDAEWLLAIAYLGNNEPDKARTQLEEIIENYPARKRKAEKLLDDMQQLAKDGAVRLRD